MWECEKMGNNWWKYLHAMMALAQLEAHIEVD